MYFHLQLGKIQLLFKRPEDWEEKRSSIARSISREDPQQFQTTGLNLYYINPKIIKFEIFLGRTSVFSVMGQNIGFQTPTLNRWLSLHWPKSGRKGKQSVVYLSPIDHWKTSLCSKWKITLILHLIEVFRRRTATSTVCLEDRPPSQERREKASVSHVSTIYDRYTSSFGVLLFFSTSLFHCFKCFYRNRVRSLAMLVTNWLTHSLTAV